jgi:hypothetical protein
MSRGLFCNNGQILVVRECRLWQKADMQTALTNVRFWGQSGQ